MVVQYSWDAISNGDLQVAGVSMGTAMFNVQ